MVPSMVSDSNFVGLSALSATLFVPFQGLPMFEIFTDDQFMSLYLPLFVHRSGLPGGLSMSFASTAKLGVLVTSPYA